MSNHYATISWRNTGPDFLGRRYSREHLWRFDGGLEIPASPSPLVVAAPWSNAASIDPEEAFVASVASCHLLWFLHMAVDAGVEVAQYEDHAVGHLTRDERGKLWISRIILHPRIEWIGPRHPAPDEVRDLHHRAHEECFIANSIRTEVLIEAP
jgi:organic hydroperoxide reductase OsmC/OhrA